MASGTIYGVTSDQKIEVKVEWSSIANPISNSSLITVELYYRSGSETIIGNGYFDISVGSTTANTWVNVSIASDWVRVLQNTVRVSHSSNGAKSVDIYATGYVPDTSLQGSEVSGTAMLDIIPMASTLDSLSCSTVYLDGTITFQYTPKNASFYNQCNVDLNLDGEMKSLMIVKMGQKESVQQTNATTFSSELLASLYSHLPSSREGVLRFTLHTYSDPSYSIEVGSGVYKEITLSIPNNSTTAPSATVTITPVSSLPSAFSSLYIQGKTKVDANFTNADGKFGASITSYSMAVDGKTYGLPYTSGYLTSAGTKTVASTVTNSRGMSTTYQRNITVIPYSAPKILDVECARCDVNGNLVDSGTYLKIKAKRIYSPVVSNGTQYNFCQIRYRYKVEGGSYSSWVTILSSNELNTDEIETAALLDGALSEQSSYYVQIQVIDDIGDYSHTTISIPTERVYMHRAASINSLGIGKYAEYPNTVDIAEDITTKLRGKVEFAEKWVELGLESNVAAYTVAVGGVSDHGCRYLVCAGERHVYVTFHCALDYIGSPVQISSAAIPKEYRPVQSVYTVSSTGGRVLARISVNTSGHVFVEWLQDMTTSGETTSYPLVIINGYLDYWT